MIVDADSGGRIRASSEQWHTQQRCVEQTSAGKRAGDRHSRRYYRLDEGRGVKDHALPLCRVRRYHVGGISIS
jgi:hypothetical protein